MRAHYLAMARYNRWMNQKLYTLCAGLSDDERKRDAGAFFHSIHGTLNHLLLADYAWMRRFTKDSDTYYARRQDGGPIEVSALDQILYDDFDALRAERDSVDALIEKWVEGLSEEDLLMPFSYRTSSGTYEHPLWWAVSHLFNHQTHHRGQLTTLLTQLGVDPGVTDLAAMLRAPVP